MATEFFDSFEISPLETCSSPAPDAASLAKVPYPGFAGETRPIPCQDDDLQPVLIARGSGRCKCDDFLRSATPASAPKRYRMSPTRTGRRCTAGNERFA